MGSLISSVVILTTLGNILYVQVRTVIDETPILFNVVKSMHDSVTSFFFYIHLFLRSMIKIDTIKIF